MSEVKKSMRWSLLGRVASKHGDGHRLFLDKENPTKVAIADNSGDLPDQCDDGVLYIDVDTIMQSGVIMVEPDLSVCIPLLVPQNSGAYPHWINYERSKTVFDVLGAADLIKMLKLRAVLQLRVRCGKSGPTFVFDVKEVDRD
jgi:hypothetical protein